MINQITPFRTATLAIIAAAIFGSGCGSMQPLNKKEKGVLIGTGSGAVVGGAIGKIAGNNPALGAIIGAAVGGVAGGIIGNRMDKQAKEIETSVPGAVVERSGEGIIVNFDEKILFQTGKSDLSTNAYTSLNTLAGILNKYPDTDLKVFGHTDDVGSNEFNQALSERRAKSAANYLASKGLSSARITSMGFGETAPKCDNATPEGKACNRRVEFTIVANEKMKQDAQKAGN